MLTTHFHLAMRLREDFICFKIYGVGATLQSLLHRNFGHNQQKQREFSLPLKPQNLKFHKRVG